MLHEISQMDGTCDVIKCPLSHREEHYTQMILITPWIWKCVPCRNSVSPSMRISKVLEFNSLSFLRQLPPTLKAIWETKQPQAPIWSLCGTESLASLVWQIYLLIYLGDGIRPAVTVAPALWKKKIHHILLNGFANKEPVLLFAAWFVFLRPVFFHTPSLRSCPSIPKSPWF